MNFPSQKCWNFLEIFILSHLPATAVQSQIFWGYEQAAKTLAYHSIRPNLSGPPANKRYLTAQDRMLGMMKVFQKYNPSAASGFHQLEKILHMQKKLSRLDPTRPESMLSLLPLLGGPDMSSMEPMLNMIKNMSTKGDISDVLKKWGVPLAAIRKNS